MRINLIISWFMNDWGMYGYEYEHIAKYFAEREHTRQVFCILPPKKLSILVPFSHSRVAKKLHLITPNDRIVPLSRFPFVRAVNNRICQVLLRSLLRGSGCTSGNTVLWVYPPHRFIDTLRSFNLHGYLITQVIDNNTLLEEIPKEEIEFIAFQYKDLALHSDAVLTASEFNYQTFSELSSRCIFFENAVDDIFISKPSMLPHMVEHRRPRVGYLGWITQRTDIELLNHVARSRPDYDLVIAGPQEVDLNKYGTLQLHNVIYRGVIPQKEAPAFLSTLDVCLIPHKDTPYSRSMSPFKIYQYLASGRPVVSTRVAGVERWKDFIAVADDYDGFVRRIDETLREDNPQRSGRRIDAVRSETFGARCAQIWEKLMPDVEQRLRRHANKSVG